MTIELKNIVNTREIYDYMVNLSFPYNYEVEFDTWEKSYLYDIDGEGRTLFSDLTTIGAYLGSKLIGFIQYGKTAFGFDCDGEISDAVFYPVIRNFYFDEGQKETGIQLLNEAVKVLSNTEGKIYAFFHYFGMSCYARQGKLFERFGYIHDLLEQEGFAIEHENMCGKGIGSQCICALKNDLFDRGITRFDTDTALSNKVAQHFYEKNSFVKEGLTRSYYI